MSIFFTQSLNEVCILLCTRRNMGIYEYDIGLVETYDIFAPGIGDEALPD